MRVYLGEYPSHPPAHIEGAPPVPSSSAAALGQRGEKPDVPLLMRRRADGTGGTAVAAGDDDVLAFVFSIGAAATGRQPRAGSRRGSLPSLSLTRRP